MSNEPFPFRTTVKLTAITIGLMGIVAYTVFQARFLIMGPQISLTKKPSMYQHERQISLAGVTHNISHLWLNGRPIYTNAQGEFEEALILENGYTIATLRAEDRYGRITTVATPFVYTPTSFIQ